MNKASRQAGKQASRQAGKQASRQAGKQLPRTLGSALSLVVLLSGCGPESIADGAAETELTSAAAYALMTSGEMPLPESGANDIELVYESVQVLSVDREPVSAAENGTLSDEVRQRVARPYQYTDEDWLYSSEAWERDEADSIVRGYRVFRQPNPEPYREKPSYGPPQLDAGARAALDKPDAGSVIAIDIGLRNFPKWDIPLLPDLASVTIDAYAERIAERERALAARAQIFEGLAAETLDLIKRRGGRVASTGPNSGWIIAVVDHATLGDLAQRTDLASISNLSGGEFREGFSLGESRATTRTQAVTFINAGYDGGQPNPSRHSFGDITIAVIEAKLFEDEACFLCSGAGECGLGTDNCNGNSRLQEIFDCDDSDSLPGDSNNNYCEPDSSIADSEEDGHGTVSASIALGNYTNGQGNGKALGDAAWLQTVTPCTSSAHCNGQACVSGLCSHSISWETRATGIAREARLIYFGQMNGDDAAGAAPADTTAAFADALDDAFDRSVDITSNSWGWMPAGGGPCDASANLSFEKEAEDAFDDGILNVACAGNEVASTCKTWAPASIPKTLAVNGLLGGQSPDCQSNYHLNCLPDRGDGIDPQTSSSAVGGANVKTNGILRSGAGKVVDMIAPANFSFTTNQVGSFGDVEDAALAGGCSVATPLVAGAAALVKDWYLSIGNSWINDPGVLHTLLLGMTDRHFGAAIPTSQRTAGGDTLYGFGRLKLRLLGTGGGLGSIANSHSNWSFGANATTITTYPFGQSGLSGSFALVKCVLMQLEDTSSDGDPPEISNIDLTINVLNSSCAGTPAPGRSDNSHDWKSMVAVESSEVSGGFTNKCIQVKLTPVSVETGGVNAKLWCYAAGVTDDAQ